MAEQKQDWLEQEVNRLVGMAVLKNDKNYAGDILKLFKARIQEAEEAAYNRGYQQGWSNRSQQEGKQ